MACNDSPIRPSRSVASAPKQTSYPGNTLTEHYHFFRTFEFVADCPLVPNRNCPLVPNRSRSKGRGHRRNELVRCPNVCGAQRAIEDEHRAPNKHDICLGLSLNFCSFHGWRKMELMEFQFQQELGSSTANPGTIAHLFRGDFAGQRMFSSSKRRPRSEANSGPTRKEPT